MSLTEVKEAVKEAVAQMTQDEFNELTQWMNEQRIKAEEANADAWDKQFEEDVNAGGSDHLIAQVEANFEAGRSKPLGHTILTHYFGSGTTSCP